MEIHVLDMYDKALASKASSQAPGREVSNSNTWPRHAANQDECGCDSSVCHQAVSKPRGIRRFSDNRPRESASRVAILRHLLVCASMDTRMAVLLHSCLVLLITA